jgi:hypothetical protein
MHSERTKPSKREIQLALKQEGLEPWRDLYRKYGWTDEETEEKEERDEVVAQRIEESGMEGWEVIKDMCSYVEAQNVPIGEMLDTFERSPGPDHW